MDASISWIKDYVPDLNCTDQEFFDRMTLSGTKVEQIARRDKNLERIVVGKIEKVEKHPDSDHLVICQVNVGKAAEEYGIENEGGLIQIVTGAPNTNVGDLVPTVLPGGRVAGGHDGSALPEDGIEIKAGKLRGVPSNGMMCSIEELGSDRNFYPEAPENGLYVFSKDKDIKPGDDAIEALGLHDSVVEFEVTSNRVDCYAIIGVAREAAATFELPFNAPQPVVHETTAHGSAEKASDYVSVEVQDKDLCPRYCARVCTDIKVGPSPEWMQRRLASCGIRPINNLVDITNFVMLEYGQPMHAFNLDTVAGHKIIVRRASDGDSFVTLDHQERKLDKDVLMICDGEKEIGIAGIMGGENSMITGDVNTVLFESATFNGPNIRKSAKRIGLRTDASGFFEKGLDPANAEAAITRACQLVEELGCGKVTAGIVEDALPLAPLKQIPLDVERINALLGTEISKEQMLTYLKPLEVTYDEQTNMLTIPSFRQDLNALCDIAEEVIRFYGYDKTPTTLPKSSALSGGRTFEQTVMLKMQERAVYCGFSQGYSYSFESPKVFDKLMLAEDAPERAAIRIVNPLGEDYSIMRTISLNGVLTSLATNYNYRNKNVHLFETGNIYLPAELPIKELPDERMQLTLGFYGDGDFFSMKGAVEEILAGVGIRTGLSYEQTDSRPYLHPGRQAELYLQSVCVGFLGEVHPSVCDTYGIGARTYVAVLDLPAIIPFASFDHLYTPLTRFPAVTRDISMVVPREISAAKVEEMITQRAGRTLEELKLFDIYEGSQIKEGFKSMAYSLSFRSAEKTLSDDEVGASMKKILNGLTSMGIELRS